MYYLIYVTVLNGFGYFNEDLPLLIFANWSVLLYVIFQSHVHKLRYNAKVLIVIKNIYVFDYRMTLIYQLATLELL